MVGYAIEWPPMFNSGALPYITPALVLAVAFVTYVLWDNWDG